MVLVRYPSGTRDWAPQVRVRTDLRNYMASCFSNVPWTAHQPNPSKFLKESSEGFMVFRARTHKKDGIGLASIRYAGQNPSKRFVSSLHSGKLTCYLKTGPL